MNNIKRPRRYMVGDNIVVELDLEHRTNLGRIFVAFHHNTDPLTEFYFETTPFPEEDWQASVVKTSRIVLEVVVTSETIPGVYTLTTSTCSPSVAGSPACGKRTCRGSRRGVSRSWRNRRRCQQYPT